MNDWLRRLLFLPEQASTIARDMDSLHYFVIIVTMVGATAVAAFTLIFIVRFAAHKHREKSAAPDVRHGYTHGGIPVWLELFVFGGLLSLFILWWVIGFRQYARFVEPPPNTLQIYVTGKQWMWTFAYPNGAASNGILYVPAGRPVTLVMTSRDVIHSFFVPDFRVKRDVVPGRATTVWFEAPAAGRHHIFCTELCGVGHSTMRGEVVVLAAEEYERQLEGLERVDLGDPRASSLAAAGERVAARRGCMRCHTADGTPHIGPTFAGLYGATIPLEGGQSVIADVQYLTSSMMDPAAQLHRGFLAVMPSYQGLLSAAEVGGLVEYIRSLRDVQRAEPQSPAPQRTDVPIVTPLQPEERR
ncbi:MAG: cytochrome c oxidase subunit II [Deltaproteobacteria bacterium]|nr:cytochrome c oxidase subunit II [Deltaproteobacteria bacterium]